MIAFHLTNETDWEIFEARDQARLEWVPVPPGRVSSIEENKERFVAVDIENAPRHYVATCMNFKNIAEKYWFTPSGRHESNTKVSDEASDLDPHSRGAAGVGTMSWRQARAVHTDESSSGSDGKSRSDSFPSVGKLALGSDFSH